MSENRIPVTCPACQTDRLLSPKAARDARRTQRCCAACQLKARQAKGHFISLNDALGMIGRAKRGFAVSAKRYGPAFATRASREWHLANPSAPERRLERVIRELRVEHYEREYEVATLTHGKKKRIYVFDVFVQINGRDILIETGNAFTHRNRTRFDRQKAAYAKKRDYELFVYDSAQVMSKDFVDQLAFDLGIDVTTCLSCQQTKLSEDVCPDCETCVDCACSCAIPSEVELIDAEDRYARADYERDFRRGV